MGFKGRRMKMTNWKKKFHERDADQELISEGTNAIKSFDENNELSVKPKKKGTKLISIRIPIYMMEELKHIALNRGETGYQQIIKEYVSLGLAKEQQMLTNRNKLNLLADNNPTSAGSLEEEFWSPEAKVEFTEQSSGAVYKELKTA